MNLTERRDMYYGEKIDLKRRKKLYTTELEWRKKKKKERKNFFSGIGVYLKIWLKPKFCMIPRVDLVLTTKCSLKCRYCANLMQYYKNPYNVDLCKIKESIQALLFGVDYVRTIYVLGGEPFLYPDLDEVLSFLIKQKKVGEICIVTNGTILPNNKKLINVMKHKKIFVRISDYRELSKKKYALTKLCKNEKISYTVMKQGRWYNCGNIQSRKRNSTELQKRYDECATLCRSILNGKLHYCPRAAHLYDLSGIGAKDDYIDLLACSKLTLKKEIRAFLTNKKVIQACNYCDIRSEGYEENKIKPAIQTKNVLEE